MRSDDFNRLERGDFDSLDAVELAIALEEAGVDPPEDDDGDDGASLVRKRSPKHPHGNSGAAAKLEDSN